MNTVHTINIKDLNGQKRTLQICVGDITDTSQSGTVDMLAISCFPDDYIPLPHTIVGQLSALGIDISLLARDKAADNRATWQTWISQSLGAHSPFGRIVCFEHGLIKRPASVVGNLFRTLTAFALAPSIGKLGALRIPLLATGDQQKDKADMLDAIIRQAYNQLRLNLPVEKVQIVLYSGWDNLHELIFKAALTIKQVQDEWAAMNLSPDPIFDFFISYRRIDSELIERILKGLVLRRPGLRFFLDKEVLTHGVFWKPELAGSIYNSQKFLCLITDSYVGSGECVDEFHAALSCGLHRTNFMLPLLSLSRLTVDTLPSTFQSVNLIDARSPPRQFDDVLDMVLGS
jgi:hypothetical protein